MANDIDTDALTDKFAELQRPLTIGVLALVVIVGGTVIWKRTQANNAAKAETAFYEASRKVEAGSLFDAQKELEKVGSRWSDTPGGIQARLLLARTQLQNGKADDAAKVLNAMGESGDFEAARHALLAAAAEDKGKFDEAAKHYEAAGKASRFELDKEQYLADQARALMTAGKKAESAKLWEQLAAKPQSPFGSEARVRLGELTATAVKN